MKKILILATAILMVSLMSCKKDNDEATNPFVGTWKIESMKVEGVSVPIGKCMIQTTYVFTDKTFQFNVVQEKDNSSDCQTKTGEGTYTISGNKLILSKENKTEEKTFSLKNDELTFEGITEDTKKPITMIFKKQ